MAKKKARTPEESSWDRASVALLERACAIEMETAFERADSITPCPIGADGLCCKNCSMGPCRLVGKTDRGVCGATIATVAARNFARAVTVGAASHSDHGRDMAYTLLEAAEGHAPDYGVRDPYKLMEVADFLDVPTKDEEGERRPINDIARDVALAALGEFGKVRGEFYYRKRAPAKRQEIWESLGITPRNIDREIVDLLHRTHIGNDQDAEHILDQTLRCALGDGWGGSMLGTDISDILFGTPAPVRSQANLGVLSEDKVNIIIHGHEPSLSEMIVAAAMDPEMIEYAKSKGAKGIQMSGICCTANETVMRQGVPLAGNFLQQELAILTGAVEAMVVDVQCIMQGIAPLADKFHTEVITTSRKVKITGATHIEFDESKALEIAKQIVRRAIDLFPKRGETHIPEDHSPLVPGFSHEYIDYALGGFYRGSLRPLNDAIMAGRIRGVVANIGCNNARVRHDELFHHVVTEFLKNDILVVETGCGAIASAKQGFMTPEAALEVAGPGLREVCETVGMPPVLHMGSCVDNSRILTVLAQMATEGGLGEDICDIPAVGMAPEWMSEKALSIATYCVASGAYVILGGSDGPVSGSEEVLRLMTEGWEEKVGGRLEFVEEAEEIVRRSIEHIDKKRAALGLPEYDASKWGRSGDRRMPDLLEIPFEERIEAVYGLAGK
ncbi:MAG: carbon-monoxide dehydrogenase catalytic subunit [Chloroflexi bacterium]|nr:MAG: carbon-monoxide dehydrogenase catalytic subunit [Chloroflexota bacterium]RLC87640.1 MAG: carbon-monoxide dehydrogenase catalytic subunit [Chloroflexota bacterium]